MSGSQQDIYRFHHREHRTSGYSILKEERSNLLRTLIGTGSTVLDIGCRDGALTRSYLPGNNVLGIDIDEVALAEAAKLGIEVMKVDLNGDWSELKGRTFDVVVLGEVLEHLYFPNRVLDKIHSLLRPGGKLIGSVPNAFSLKNRLRYLAGRKKYTPLGDPTHINHFSKNELVQLLTQKFRTTRIIGLGRYERLARMWPGMCAFNLFFIAEK